MEILTENITPVEELEDGSTVYKIGSDNEEQISNDNFYANLAEELSESSRNKLSTYLYPSQMKNKVYKKYLNISNNVI